MSGGGGRWGGLFPQGGGVLGPSEQLGMRPWCDLTVRTAPSHKRGWGIIGLGIPTHTGNLRGVGREAVMGSMPQDIHLYIHTYIHSHSHSNNHLSCRLLELPGISHRQVVPASLDPVGPRAA